MLDFLEKFARLFWRSETNLSNFKLITTCKFIFCAISRRFPRQYFHVLFLLFLFLNAKLLNWLSHFCICTHPSTPTQKYIRHENCVIKIALVSERHAIKQPAYCRSLCSDRFMKSSFKAKHMHDRNDGFKKRKKTRKRSERDLHLLRSYRNNIPSGTCCTIVFFLFCFDAHNWRCRCGLLVTSHGRFRQGALQHLRSNPRRPRAGRRWVWRIWYPHGEDPRSTAR